MIKSLRHRGLKRLYQHADAGGLRSAQLNRISDVLAHLDRATKATDLDLPGYRLHRLKGQLAGFWSVTISGNWRMIFRFQEGDAFDVDLIDYH